MVEHRALAFEVIECCNCHVQFCVTQEHEAKLVETKETFYCPNGHPQSYTGKSNKQVIKDLRNIVTQCRNQKNATMDDLAKMEKTANAYKMLFHREKKKSQKLNQKEKK